MGKKNRKNRKVRKVSRYNKPRISHATITLPIPPEEEFRAGWKIDIAKELREAGHEEGARLFEKVKHKANATHVEAKDGYVILDISWEGPPYFDKP